MPDVADLHGETIEVESFAQIDALKFIGKRLTDITDALDNLLECIHHHAINDDPYHNHG